MQVVLGPAADGGYYLLGLKSVHPTLFEVTCKRIMRSRVFDVG